MVHLRSALAASCPDSQILKLPKSQTNLSVKCLTTLASLVDSKVQILIRGMQIHPPPCLAEVHYER